MKNGSILIISNQENIGNQISKKIKLLRDCDTIKIVDFIEAISTLNTIQPSLIIVYCSNTDSVSIIKEIRTIKSLDKVPILFVMDSLVEEKLFYAFDNGIDDFFFLTDTDSIILMRIFLTLQKGVLYKQIETDNEIFTAANIIDKQSGIYSKEQAPLILRNFFSKSIEENLENTVFMYVKPLSIENKRLNMPKIASIIKSIPRSNDIVAYGKSAGYYIILYNAGELGANNVAERIKKSLVNICDIYAIAAEITKPFEEMEPVLYELLKNQITDGIKFRFINDITINDAIEVIDIKDEQGKKYKEFKKEFIENFEKIVAPVFYQVQTFCNKKLPESEVKYDINEKESRFTITNKKDTAELILNYTTYTNVIVDIKYIQKDVKPKIKRLTIEFEDFSEEKLNSLLEEILNEYTNMQNLNTLYPAEQ